MPLTFIDHTRDSPKTPPSAPPKQGSKRKYRVWVPLYVSYLPSKDPGNDVTIKTSQASNMSPPPFLAAWSAVNTWYLCCPAPLTNNLIDFEKHPATVNEFSLGISNASRLPNPSLGMFQGKYPFLLRLGLVVTPHTPDFSPNFLQVTPAKKKKNNTSIKQSTPPLTTVGPVSA